MEKILEVKDLRKSYKDKLILDNINFSLKPKEIVGLVGANGAGKTTLMKLILGFIFKDSGEIKFYNESSFHNNRELMNKIGFLIDTRIYEHLNAEENIKIQMLYRNVKDRKKTFERAKYLLELVGLNNVDKKISDYSFGMKQRLSLTLSLLSDVKLLILDEPFVGLDPNGIVGVKNFIKEIVEKEGIALLISSHQMNEIDELCSRFLILKDKKIINHNLSKDKVYIFNTLNNLDFIKNNINGLKIIKNKIYVNDKKNLDLAIDFIRNNNISLSDIELEVDSMGKVFKEVENEKSSQSRTI